MRKSKTFSIALAALAIALSPLSARAEDTLKVGLVAPFSGPFADYGKQMYAGIKTYLAQHGDVVAGKKITIIMKDTTGPVPEIARRAAQELVVRDQVDFLAGFGLTPEAMAAADIATQAKKPMVVMNAGTSTITTKSPYIVRFSHTLAQFADPLGTWAAHNGITKVVSVVSDYGPGIDSETAFKKAFTAAGGEVVDSIRVPLKSPEFSPFIQRIKDAHPQAVFVFVPAGEQGIGFMKGFRERGLADAGIKVIATGDITDEHVLDAMGDVAVGMITSFHYSEAHNSPENKAFLEAYRVANPDAGRANFMAVAAYDGMNAICKTAEKLGGTIDGEKAVEVLKTMAFTSPRGPIAIDPQTRDIVQTIYFRRVEKVGGIYQNVEFDSVANVKDPGK